MSNIEMTGGKTGEQDTQPVGTKPPRLAGGLDWPRMFPLGPSREALLQILRAALEDVRQPSQDGDQ